MHPLYLFLKSPLFKTCPPGSCFLCYTTELFSFMPRGRSVLCVLLNEVVLAFKWYLGFLTFCFQLISIKIQAQYSKKKHLQDVFLVIEKRTFILQIVLGKCCSIQSLLFFLHFSCNKNVSVLVRKQYLGKQSTC